MIVAQGAFGDEGKDVEEGERKQKDSHGVIMSKTEEGEKVK